MTSEPGESGALYERSQAVTAVVLAALSWFACGPVLSIPAFVIARRERAAIQAGLRDPQNRSTAEVAYWLPLSNFVLILGALLLALLALGGMMVFGPGIRAN